MEEMAVTPLGFSMQLKNTEISHNSQLLVLVCYLQGNAIQVFHILILEVLEVFSWKQV